jgi:hypothetical protein
VTGVRIGTFVVDFPFYCPCCLSTPLLGKGNYEICGKCGWEDDPFQKENPDETGANHISLREARIYWQLTGKPLPPNATPEMDKIREVFRREDVL